jgi:hypothetical protein
MEKSALEAIEAEAREDAPVSIAVLQDGRKVDHHLTKLITLRSNTDRIERKTKKPKQDYYDNLRIYKIPKFVWSPN